MCFIRPSHTRSRNGESAFATALLAHLPRITHPRYLDKKLLLQT